jgi:hypothetical protein
VLDSRLRGNDEIVESNRSFVTPAKAGVQFFFEKGWIPAAARRAALSNNKSRPFGRRRPKGGSFQQ